MALGDELRQYVLGGGHEAGLKQPLPDEYMDLNGDERPDFDATDLAVAEAADGARVGGPRVGVSYHHADHLGSTTHVTTASGALISQQVFLAYGEPASRSGVEPLHGFTGMRRDLFDIGIVHMGAREYSPGLGRWITPDRYIGESPRLMVEKVLEAGLYGYARNTPTLLIDPTGKEGIPSIDTEVSNVMGKVDRLLQQQKRNFESEVSARILEIGSDLRKSGGGSQSFSVRTKWQVGGPLARLGDVEGSFSFGGVVTVDGKGAISFSGSASLAGRLKLPGLYGSKTIVSLSGRGILGFRQRQGERTYLDYGFGIRASVAMRWEASIGDKKGVYTKAFGEVGGYGTYGWSNLDRRKWDIGFFGRAVADMGTDSLHIRQEYGIRLSLKNLAGEMFVVDEESRKGMWTYDQD